jgi:hypothetical protein
MIVLGNDLGYTFFIVNFMHGVICFQAIAPISFVENRQNETAAITICTAYDLIAPSSSVR